MPLVPINPISGANRCMDPAAAARTAGPPAEQFRDELADRQSFRERVPVPPVRAENGIIGTEVRAYACCNCFLADVRVARAMNQSARVTSCELLLRRSNQLHRAVQISARPESYGAIPCHDGARNPRHSAPDYRRPSG